MKTYYENVIAENTVLALVDQHDNSPTPSTSQNQTESPKEPESESKIFRWKREQKNFHVIFNSNKQKVSKFQSIFNT